MRVAIVTETRALVGGVETYLDGLMPSLARRHTLAFWTPSSRSSERGAIGVPDGVDVLNGAGVVDPGRVTAFRPDVVFSHGLADPTLEAAVAGAAPVVHLQHNYHGTCISGSKTQTLPTPHVCGRRFGPACLALYFPRGCGGKNPLTMVSMYRRQAARLSLVERAAALVTLSTHMRDELLRHGVTADRVHVVPPFVTLPPKPSRAPRVDVSRLTFLGRLEPLKGVDRLIRALPAVRERLGRPVVLSIAGEGAERAALESAARHVEANASGITIRFQGWLSPAGRARLLDESDALVVPSIWPEPYGLVGVEAGAAGVPSVAFAHGGIVDWLEDGQTGCLAPSDGARPGALADAIVRCVKDPDVRTRLGDEARARAAALTLDRHLDGLDRVFALATGARGGTLR